MSSLPFAAPRISPSTVRLVGLASVAWLIFVALIAGLAAFDAQRRGVDGRWLSAMRMFALGFAPWLALTPLLFAWSRDQARRRPPPVAAARDALVAFVITIGLIVLYALTIYAAVLGVSPVAVLRGMPLLDWLWDALLFVVVVLAGRLAGARSEPADSVVQPTSASARLIVRSSDRVEFLEPDAIDAGTAQGNYVALFCAGREILHRATLEEVLSQLAEHGAVRVHRSHFVRPDRVASASSRAGVVRAVRLADGRLLPVSRRYAEAIGRALGILRESPAEPS